MRNNHPEPKLLRVPVIDDDDADRNKVCVFFLFFFYVHGDHGMIIQMDGSTRNVRARLWASYMPQAC